jgi:hypothetical protein
VSTVGVDVVSAAEVTVGGSPIAKWLERGTWPGENLEVFAVDSWTRAARRWRSPPEAGKACQRLRPAETSASGPMN